MSRCGWKQHMGSAVKITMARSSKGGWRGQKRRRECSGYLRHLQPSLTFPKLMWSPLLDLSIPGLLCSPESPPAHMLSSQYLLYAHSFVASWRQGLLKGALPIHLSIEFHAEHHRFGPVACGGAQYLLK